MSADSINCAHCGRAHAWGDHLSCMDAMSDELTATREQVRVLREAAAEWLPILERQLKNLLASAPAIRCTRAYTAGSARIERLRAALAQPAPPEPANPLADHVREVILPILASMPEPRIGEWNWPEIREQLEALLPPAPDRPQER